jgi:CRISPR system Cascade subunit CasE
MLEPAPLSLVQLSLDTRRLFALGRQLHLPLESADVDYLAHCALSALFGRHCPKPFRSHSARGGRLPILGYSQAPESALREHADQFGDPLAHAAIDWDGFAVKAMPASFAVGRRYGFEVRACPTLRKHAASDRHKKGAEVDVFLSRCWEVGDPSIPVDREAVYLDWLKERLSDGGARLESGQLTSFQRSHLLRRRQGGERGSRRLERPDALLRGNLAVVDPDAFAGMLRRGIGRHRTFGFGMLLLRPAGP